MQQNPGVELTQAYENCCANKAKLFPELPPEYYSEIEVFAMFKQMWSSTALGFGGIGGSAMTAAYTIVLDGGNRDFYIYFGGSYAGLILNPNDKFIEDIHR